MSDFEQDFRARVQGGEAQSTGSAAPDQSGVEKKPIDKRWFVIGGLVILLVVVLIVLVVMSGGKNEDIKVDSIVGTWSCDDDSEIIFSGDGDMSWTDDVGIMRDKYVIEGSTIKFGAVKARYSNNQITVNVLDKRSVVCGRQQ